MKNNSRHGLRPEWKEVKRFIDDQFVVAVSVLQGFKPKYSIQVGRLRDDGLITPHIPIHVVGPFQVKVTPITKVVDSLLQMAEEWISSEAALSASDDIESRIEKETRQANFGKQETRHTGKTAKKKAKKLGQLVSQ